MSVSTFTQPDHATQVVDDYLSNIDGDISVLSRVAAAFAPHESDPVALTVTVDAGSIFDGATLTEIAAQATAAIAPPSADPRIDRIVIDRATGVIDVVTGTESATPTPPTIPDGFAPIAQVALDPSSTEITNAMITDERSQASIGPRSGELLNVQRFDIAGTFIYAPTAGTRTVIVEVLGGGGSGGGCAAPAVNQGAAAGGGGAGAFAKARLVSGFAGQTIVVGAGGAATIAGAVVGNSGGASSFGSLIIAPGGQPGPAGPAETPPNATRRSDVSSPATGGNILNCFGAAGDLGLILTPNEIAGGSGGNSIYSAGSSGSFFGDGTGSPGAIGSGGGGASSQGGSTAHSGGAGGTGLVVVYEYA